MTKIVEYSRVEILRKELVVLKNVTFSINKGEFAYLVGRVGSGKSSLLKSMYAEIPIPEGDAKVLEYDLTDIKRRDVPMLRRKMGIVFQDFQLLTDRSVYDNLLFVLKATGWKSKQDIDDRIDTVLKEVGMTNKSYKMPHELSGGEQQRIAIARAIVNDPILLIADEPTGNLDPETSWEIMDIFREVNKSGTTIVMATHDREIVDEMEKRVIAIEHGHIVRDDAKGVYGYES